MKQRNCFCTFWIPISCICMSYGVPYYELLISCHFFSFPFHKNILIHLIDTTFFCRTASIICLISWFGFYIKYALIHFFIVIVETLYHLIFLKLSIIKLNLFTDAVVIVAIIILMALFSIQCFGTSKVGFLFAPIIALWLFSLGSIGIYNLVKHDITVLRAFNPAYIYYFFKKNSKDAWSALGGCVLCITGIS